MVFSSHTDPVEDGVMAPKDVHILLPETCGHALEALQGQDQAVLWPQLWSPAWLHEGRGSGSAPPGSRPG